MIKKDALIIRTEIYDDVGFPLPPTAEEGYDINGFPVSRTVGVVVDGKWVIP